jgi:UDP-N-acetyl-D-galactosamine dehydrogenase
MFKEEPYEGKVLIDIKGILDRKEYETAGYRYWRL